MPLFAMTKMLVIFSIFNCKSLFSTVNQIMNLHYERKKNPMNTFHSCQILLFIISALFIIKCLFYFALPSITTYINTTCYIITFGCLFTCTDMNSKALIFCKFFVKSFNIIRYSLDFNSQSPKSSL